VQLSFKWWNGAVPVLAILGLLALSRIRFGVSSDELQAIVEAQGALDAANAALTARRNALAELREEGHALAHQLATARARRDTVVRRLAELDRRDSSLSGDIAREEALKSDAARAIAQLEQERGAIEQRLADGESHSARIATDLGIVEASSREAEAGLAELLARQASMRAEASGVVRS